MFCLRRDVLRLRTSLLQSVLLRLRLLDLLSGLDIELIRIAVDFSHTLYRGILLLKQKDYSCLVAAECRFYEDNAGRPSGEYQCRRCNR